MVDAVFAMFDKNSDGQMDAKELKQLLAVYTGAEPTPDAVGDILAKCDSDKDGTISKVRLQ